MAEEAKIAKIEKSEAEAEIKFRQNYNADVARKREMNKYFNAKPGRKKSNGGLKPPKSSKKRSVPLPGTPCPPESSPRPRRSTPMSSRKLSSTRRKRL